MKLNVSIAVLMTEHYWSGFWKYYLYYIILHSDLYAITSTAVQDSTDFDPRLTLICQGSLNHVCPSKHMGLFHNTTAIFSGFYLKPLTYIGFNRKSLWNTISNRHIYLFSCSKALMIISTYYIFSNLKRCLVYMIRVETALWDLRLTRQHWGAWNLDTRSQNL